MRDLLLMTAFIIVVLVAILFAIEKNDRLASNQPKVEWVQEID